MSAEKPFNKYSLPGRLKPLKERRPERPYTTLPSWDIISKKLEIMTYSNYDLLFLFQNNREVLKDYFDARSDIAMGKGREKLEAFTKNYTENETSNLYNPELIDKLSPLITVVRDSFPNFSKKRR